MATKKDLIKHREACGFLICSECLAEASGNPDDYFDCPDDHKFDCANEHDPVTMDLVIKQVTYVSLISGKEFVC